MIKAGGVIHSPSGWIICQVESAIGMGGGRRSQEGSMPSRKPSPSPSGARAGGSMLMQHLTLTRTLTGTAGGSMLVREACAA